MKSSSILGSSLIDFLSFYLVAILVVIYFSFFQQYSTPYFLMFFALVLIDGGHVYATLWRTYFNKAELFRAPIYFISPLVIFSICFIWNFLGLPYFWAFVMYFTYFHHLRQYYGIYAWYSYLDKHPYSFLKYYLYAFLLIPFILFHFRGIDHVPFYHQSELFLTYFSGIQALIRIELAILITSFSWLIYLCYKKKISLNVLFSLIMPLSIVHISLLTFSRFEMALIPLIIGHGLTYMAMSGKALQKLKTFKFANNKYLLWGILSLTLIFFAVAEYTIKDDYIAYVDSRNLAGLIFPSLIISAITLPTLLHYYLDSKIWKKDHPEFKTIIGQSQS